MWNGRWSPIPSVSAGCSAFCGTIPGVPPFIVALPAVASRSGRRPWVWGRSRALADVGQEPEALDLGSYLLRAPLGGCGGVGVWRCRVSLAGWSLPIGETVGT